MCGRGKGKGEEWRAGRLVGGGSGKRSRKRRCGEHHHETTSRWSYSSYDISVVSKCINTIANKCVSNTFGVITPLLNQQPTRQHLAYRTVQYIHHAHSQKPHLTSHPFAPPFSSFQPRKIDPRKIDHHGRASSAKLLIHSVRSHSVTDGRCRCGACTVISLPHALARPSFPLPISISISPIHPVIKHAVSKYTSFHFNTLTSLTSLAYNYYVELRVRPKQVH